MIKVRNRLLILTAILTVGLVGLHGVSNATVQYDWTGGTSPVIGPSTGEPDGTGSGIKTTAVAHGVTASVPGDTGNAPAPRASWFLLAFRIWAATYLRGGL
jgi:hypothetical protein